MGTLVPRIAVVPYVPEAVLPTGAAEGGAGWGLRTSSRECLGRLLPTACRWVGVWVGSAERRVSGSPECDAVTPSFSPTHEQTEKCSICNTAQGVRYWFLSLARHCIPYHSMPVRRALWTDCLVLHCFVVPQAHSLGLTVSQYRCLIVPLPHLIGSAPGAD